MNICEQQTACTHCSVRNRALFRGVPKNKLDRTQNYRDHQVSIPAKGNLYTEGTSPTHVYTLYEGFMALYQTSKNGKRQIHRFALPGDFLGFQIAGNGVISYSVMALTKSIACGFPRNSLKEMLSSQSNLALRLASMEARDMNICQYHQAFRGRKDAYESVAFLLLELFHRTRKQIVDSYNPDENSVYFPLTQEDIGDAVGLTNVYVNKVIRHFHSEGLLKCNRKRLYILNEEKLSELAEFEAGLITCAGLV
jgi:CRP-like cAMP-binding protein